MIPPIPETARRIERLAERVVYRNAFVVLHDDAVRFPDGTEGAHVRLATTDASPGVAMVVTCDDELALVLSYRYAIAQWEWGIPRGWGSGDDAEASALRELREELGGQPVSLTPLGMIHPDSGLLAQEVHVFHAAWRRNQLVPEDRREIQGTCWATWEEIDEAIVAGRIHDGFTLSALALAAARGLRPRVRVTTADGGPPAALP